MRASKVHQRPLLPCPRNGPAGIHSRVPTTVPQPCEAPGMGNSTSGRSLLSLCRSVTAWPGHQEPPRAFSLSLYRLSLVPLVQPHPYIWKEGIDTPACSPIHVHVLPYTVCKERTCSSIPILVTLGFCRLFFGGSFLYWERALLPARTTASTSLSPACQKNDGTEGTWPTAAAHRLPGQSCTVVKELKPAL